MIVYTLFQDTYKPLQLWFQAIWHIVSPKNGVRALGLQRALGLGSYHNKLRRTMVQPCRYKLSGAGEINETIIGGAKSGERGHGAGGKTLVLIEQWGIGRIRLTTFANVFWNRIRHDTAAENKSCK
ncbi:hypothetical protein [Legionella steelei]|uniref:hypothetical protein n=1 Tax=Legionella steelei TaxID=947033 RepID=UPI0007302E6A